MKTKTSNHKPTQEQIAQRAYAIFEQSGRVAGRDLQNWLQAERELSASVKQAPEAKEPKSNGRATAPQAIGSARGESRLERKYA